MRALLVLMTACAPAIAARAPPEDRHQETAQKEVAALVRKGQGASVVVIVDGAVSWARGFGGVDTTTSFCADDLAEPFMRSSPPERIAVDPKRPCAWITAPEYAAFLLELLDGKAKTTKAFIDDRGKRLDKGKEEPRFVTFRGGKGFGSGSEKKPFAAIFYLDRELRLGVVVFAVGPWELVQSISATIGQLYGWPSE